jgi:hypothetical protein
MYNPFEKRATEQVINEEAFLALISPEPLNVYLKPYAETGQLYDRLAIFLGTPGSGKTTSAKLYEYPVLNGLLRQRGNPAFRALLTTMTDLNVIENGKPKFLACRLPLESDYGEIWEFPYPEDLREGLFKAFVQARAMLAWFRHLDRAGIIAERVSIVASGSSAAALESIGGDRGPNLLKRALEVERQIYSAVGALLAPKAGDIGNAVTQTYRPFDSIQQFRIEVEGDVPLDLQPLLVLDDAHNLSSSQFGNVTRWLARRELRIARWILTRWDVLPPEEAIASILLDESDGSLPGITTARDITLVSFQRVTGRREHRQTFRKMAKDMANRYLSQMQQFASRRLDDLSSMLDNSPEHLTVTRTRELQQSVSSSQKSLHVSDDRRVKLLETIKEFDTAQRDLEEDDRLAMLRILMHRYAKRVPQQQLFGSADPEPARPLNADVSVYDAARLHLLHDYERPFYYGIDDLCDASSENAEQFLRLAAILVEALSTKLIRSRQAHLTSAEQDDLLRKRADEFIRGWNFPQFDRVKHLVESIASLCLKVSLEPNAWIGAGANAYGILQSDFDQVHFKNSELARTLQFAVAYNAINVVPRYECKNQLWCLLELGGLVILRHGLSLKRGGFVEGTAEELALIDRSFTQ